MPSTSVKIIVRHSASCKDKKKGAEWRQCDCPKSLLVYTGGGSGANRRISAHTRSWEQAEKVAVKFRDSLDPREQELRRLRAVEESKQKPIAEAITDYIADMRARNLASGTTENSQSLLQRMADYLKPITVSDVTLDALSKWRATWGCADGTASTRVSNLKAFFTFAEGRKWIDESPAERLKRPKVTGGKTAIFSDAQLNAIAKAAEGDRITLGMFELLRWSGCSISDACKFSLTQLDSNGILRFRRQKTAKLAVAKLPAHVVALLKTLPGDRPFSECVGGTALKSKTRRWQDRFQVVFAKAGIATVETGSGRVRRPHIHMLRDSAAVSKLRQGVSVHSVALMLGDTISTVEKHYLPYCQELETAHIAELAAAERAEVAALPKPSRKVSAIA